VVMPLIARLGLPMPLGGTSNHFRVSALRELGAWDAFNVTEDADLGIRMARLGYRAAMLDSATREEMPERLWPWMKQRSRWTKGWMQTFLVHNRNPLALIRGMGWVNALAFEIYVGALILSPLFHTAFLVGFAVALVRGFALPLDDIRTWLEALVFLVGYGGAGLTVVTGLRRARIDTPAILATQLLLPAYWILHSAATVIAAYELVVKPHYWAKTDHGVSGMARPPRRWGWRRVAVQ
jgi:glycosyltransferase XagB